MENSTAHREMPAEVSLPEIEQQDQSRGMKIGLIVGGVLILGLLIAGLVFLLQPGTDTGKVRDIFIIFLALEFLLIGLALIILIIQVARLSYLLQHEIKPILESTTETVNTLRGTTTFMSEHLVRPVIKLNEYLAGLSGVLKYFRPKK
jgi:Ca2+/Na+ antiporter